MTGCYWASNCMEYFVFVTRFGMLLLEVSVFVFLLQGNYVSRWDALKHILILSTTIASVDTIIKAIYIFGFGVPLFINNNDTGDWQKWGFWLVDKLIFVVIYASILSLPHTNGTTDYQQDRHFTTTSVHYFC
jgi:hypothetical protein